MSERNFQNTVRAVLAMVKLAEPGEPRRQVELCLACAVRLAIEQGHDERGAFDAVDALFTVMMSDYFSIAHDEQSRRG